MGDDDQTRFHAIWNKVAILKTNLDVLDEALPTIGALFDWADRCALGGERVPEAITDRNVAYLKDDVPALVRESRLCMAQLEVLLRAKD